MMRTRTVAIVCALALLAAGCGSRLSDEELSAGAGTGGGGGPVATTPGDSVPDGEDATGPMFGTMEAPCGEAPEGFAPTASDTGITEDVIKIGVVSDRAGAVKVPTASIEETVTAFVEWCNGLGGINGRELQLVAYDAKLQDSQEAIKAACAEGLFALVGSGTVFDQLGAKAGVECGIPDVAAYSATPEKTLAPNVWTPIPNPPESNLVGPARYLAEQNPEAAKSAGLISSDAVATAWNQALRLQDSWAGIVDVTKLISTGIFQESYSAEVRQLDEAGVGWVTMVSEPGEGLKLLRDIEAQGFEPDVVFFGTQYYDPVLLTESYSNGSYIEINTIPFEEADQVPAMQQYLDIYDAIGSDIKPTALGVQSFSAALLFAEAASNAGAELTRTSLQDEIKKITSWDGGGLHFETNPAERSRRGCFILMQIQEGEFKRVFPEEPGTFSCDPENIAPVKDPKLNGSQVQW